MSFIRPILEYADVIWDSQNQSLINKLENVQLDAARIVTGGTKLTELKTDSRHSRGYILCSSSRRLISSFLRGFSRKTKRSSPDPLISLSVLSMMSVH
jgi:hypothetical protein